MRCQSATSYKVIRLREVASHIAIGHYMPLLLRPNDSAEGKVVHPSPDTELFDYRRSELLPEWHRRSRRSELQCRALLHYSVIRQEMVPLQ